MRRSRSSSNIPLPKFRRNGSSENLTCARNSQTGLRRSISSSNLLSVPKSYQDSRVECSSNNSLAKFGRNGPSESLSCSSNRHSGMRRSISSSNLLSVPKVYQDCRVEWIRENDDVPSSTSKHLSRRFTATPLRAVENAAVGRRFTATPLRSVEKSAGGRRITGTPLLQRRSPVLLLTTRKINDKKFSSDQYMKICEFVREKMVDFDPKCLKPLTLATFVQIMSMLFAEIDPRINITMANYKEVVLKYLKLYKYPGPVSMSLLKSVNTNLSWAQVMSIFGWLVDLIDNLNSADDENDRLEPYILGRAKNTIQSGSDTRGLYIQYIEEMLNLDRAEVEMFANECEMLKKDAENKRILIKEQKEQERILAEKLEQMKSDIQEFKEDNIEEKIINETCELKAEYKIRESEIENMNLLLSEKQQAISNQKFSIKDKQELLNKFEDEKYSLALKKEELENIHKLKCDYDYQQTDCRRQIETKIHEINGRLLHLQLGNFIDDNTKIRLPDRGLHGQTFLKEIEEMKELLENINKKVGLENQQVQEVLSTKSNECKELCDDMEKVKRDINSLKNELEKINDEKSRVLFESDFVRKQHEKEVSQTMASAPNVDSIKKKNLELQEEVSILKNKMEVMNEDSMKLCKLIYDETKQKASHIRAMMTDLKEKAVTAYEQRVLQEKEIDRMTSQAI